MKVKILKFKKKNKKKQLGIIFVQSTCEFSHFGFSTHEPQVRLCLLVLSAKACVSACAEGYAFKDIAKVVNLLIDPRV